MSRIHTSHTSKPPPRSPCTTRPAASPARASPGTVVVPQFYICGSGLARGGESGMPRDGSTHHRRSMARLGRDAHACRCCLRATVVTGAWSSVRSKHTCGKAVSTSALVDAPALPPALDTRVQAGEGERDADDADADGDADADAGPSSGALSPLRAVTRVFRGAGGAPRCWRGHTRWREQFARCEWGATCNVCLEQLFRELWTHLRPQFSLFPYSLSRISVRFDARDDFVW
ncbi:hypothetical protein B0H14DRAFT_2826909 [Mycena olivaceomarginata]|nr:hypothetical protein B0H14DRAFT_2826909 [Mycena olivaceomarginata]